MCSSDLRDENIKQAERENWRFVHDGIPPQINETIDDHQTHWNVHLKLALTSDFETWPDEMKTEWLFHMAQHKHALIAAMMPAPAAQMPAPGGKTRGSNGSQPEAQPRQPAEPGLPGGPM